MKFKAMFEINPPGVFGLPDGTKVVVPSGPTSTEMLSDQYHVRTLARVVYGTLSRYRDENTAINEELGFGEITGTLKDNLLALNIEASSGQEAGRAAFEVVNRFTQHLTLSFITLFSYKLLYLENEKGELVPLPKRILFTYTRYNLDSLRTSIKDAERRLQLSDTSLDKAMQYYEHALFLFTPVGKMTDVSSKHYGFIISAAFLNLWKAASTIVGDPSVDKDYQKRYARLGFDRDFFESSIEFVRERRNSYDVAHYHVGPDYVKDIETNFGKAKKVTERILHAYCEYLEKGNPPLKP